MFYTVHDGENLVQGINMGKISFLVPALYSGLHVCLTGGNDP